jgi:hypothetical protein
LDECYAQGFPCSKENGCPLPDGWYFNFEGQDERPHGPHPSREDAIEASFRYIDGHYEETKS